MKKEAPAAARNRAPIADILAEELPENGTVLELASGTGEHAVYFASRFPNLQFQPSDFDVENLPSIAAWRDDAGLTNILDPIKIDASSDDWGIAKADAIVCINMIHISPIAATYGLLRGAGRILPEGGALILYGPYREEGVETVQSNLDFEVWLKNRNPEFGLRSAEWLDDVAREQGLKRTQRIAMPANNIMLVYRKG